MITYKSSELLECGEQFQKKIEVYKKMIVSSNNEKDKEKLQKKIAKLHFLKDEFDSLDYCDESSASKIKSPLLG